MNFKTLRFLLLGLIFGLLFFNKTKKIYTEKKQQQSFTEFLSYFEEVELPFETSIGYQESYSIDTFDVKEKTKNKKIVTNQMLKDWDEIKNEFIPETKLSFRIRMRVHQSLAPYVKFYPNDKVVTIIYISFVPMGNARNYRMLTYDLNGNLLFYGKGSKNYFDLGGVYQSQNFAIQISKEGVIRKDIFKPKDREGFYQNRLSNKPITFENVKTDFFEIKEYGKIEKIKEVHLNEKL